MIRRILVPVRGDGKGDNVTAHAAAPARRFDAHVEVTHCRARAEDMLPYGVPIPACMRKQIFDQAGQLADQEEAVLRDELQILAGKLRLDLSGAPGSQTPTASWAEEQGR